ncbi:rhodanese-like domain-containing protein [Streptomyces phaeochromogenes]|uniref:rhodanese-like domain-containing protein n=1 Tax=Streptomyces phaeochromogenes TaxID=1923 RepID=UPI0033C510C8
MTAEGSVRAESPVGTESPVGIDELLERVREGLDRVEADAAHEAARAGEALLVDIRYAALRERDGLIPGALVVERNELEWRLDPQGSHRAPEATSHGLHVVIVCNEGYASSLAATSLRQLGLHRATDLVGGFQAWRAAGLPVVAALPAAGPPVASRGSGHTSRQTSRQTS